MTRNVVCVPAIIRINANMTGHNVHVSHEKRLGGGENRRQISLYGNNPTEIGLPYMQCRHKSGDLLAVTLPIHIWSFLL